MGQHSLPAGLQFRNIVFRDQILFVELDHGFQLTVADGRFLILPDILAVFTLTGQIRLGKSCVSIGRDLSPEAFAVSRLENTGHVCRARTVNEEYLQEVVIQAINQVSLESPSKSRHKARLPAADDGSVGAFLIF